MSFCGGHFEFGWVIFIMTDWLEFRVWVFWQPFWTSDFTLQILVSAHFTSEQKLPFAIQGYSDSENPGCIRKNTMDVLEKS